MFEMARHSLLAVALASALLDPHPDAAEAQERPKAQVRFELAHPAYRDEFLDEEIDDIQTAAALRLASFLNARIGFIDFSTDPGPAYVLKVSLDARDRGAGLALSDVGFHFELEGPGMTEAARSYWLFRSKDSGEPIPEQDLLLSEVDLLLKTEVADTRGLVREVLRLVRITGECALKTDQPEGWILPFSAEDLCIDRGTLLRITHGVRDGGVDRDVTLDYRANGTMSEGPLQGHAFCEATTEDGEAQLEELRTARVMTRGIFVIDYDPPDDGCALTPESPDMVSFGSGEP
jgi:hypothetical protein